MNEAADFLFRCNPEPGWIYDRETLRFLAVNEAAIARYGYSEDEFLEMTIADIGPDADVSRLLKLHENRTAGPADAGRWRHTSKTGETIIADIRLFPVTFTGRAAVIASARDVTALASLETLSAEQERKSRETMALLSMAGRVARFGGWRVDLATGDVTRSDETAAIHEAPNVTGTIEAGLDYYVPEHRPIIENAFKACVEDGAPFDLILQIVTGKGRKIWIRTIGEPERDAQGRIVAAWGAFQDINELVLAHARADATRNRLAQTLDSISEGFMLLDRDWRLTFINRAGEAFLLRPDGNLVGRNIWEEFPEARGSQFETSYRRAVDTGEPVTFQEFYPPLRRWFEVRAHPTPDGLAVHFRDVTNRWRATEALRLSDERFRLVTAVTNDVIWDWNLATNEIWWSDHMASQFGHSTQGNVSAGFWESHIHPADRPRIMAGVMAAIDRGDAGWSDEYRFLRHDGSEARVIDRALIIRDSSGVAERMVGSMTDVTARMATEAQLREAQKLEAVGQLTGGVAHDFNNLLTVIIGSAETLAERLADDAEGSRLAETAAAAAQRGADLTSRLLAFARQQPLEPKTIDLDRLVSDFLPILRRSLNEDVKLELAGAEKVWAVTADQTQLETALLNLVINARDSMPAGGRLAIEFSNLSFDAAEAGKMADLSAGDYVLITVSDTGAGMTPEIASRVFEPFFTTKEVGRGSGLGLSMVYGFIKQSRGHAAIVSEPGVGTTVRLYLPRAHEKQVSADTPCPAESALPTGTERVLVVEDDALVRDHVARQLRGLGYAVTETSNGSQALKRLEAGETFDLLFTDVVMPGGMNGRELAVVAQRLCPKLKVLFTSGYTENAMVHHGRLDLGVQLLSKPYRKRDLALRIRCVLDE